MARSTKVAVERRGQGTGQTKRRFNLVDSPWIPVVGKGLLSLEQVFGDDSLRSFGGTPLQKIALTKLFLAIAHAAWFPKDREEWRTVGPKGMADRVLACLKKWRDAFWLYGGDRPFLQVAVARNVEVKSFGVPMPEVATGNTTVLFQSQKERPYSDAEKALLLVQLDGFAFGGKQAKNAKNETVTASAGPWLGSHGYLHTFLLGDSIRNTVWINMFTEDELSRGMSVYAEGLGTPPWERMPVSETDATAKRLRESLMGRWVPLCRFVWLEEDGLHYAAGLDYPSHNEGGMDPSVAVDMKKKKPKVLWANPDRRPWRDLPALLALVLGGANGGGGYENWHIRYGLPAVRDVWDKFGVWSGGVRVTSKAGEQYLSGGDDYVESEVWLFTKDLGEVWFNRLRQAIQKLEKNEERLCKAVAGYYADLKEDGSDHARFASRLYWQYCERDFGRLLRACSSEDECKKSLSWFGGFVVKAYEEACPHVTSRQMDVWAKHLPSLAD